jgi:hypothetical protein
MSDDWKVEPIPPDEWWPPEFEKRTGDVLMEFPELIRSLLTIAGRTFVTLESGKIIDCTDLLGKAKH